MTLSVDMVCFAASYATAIVLSAVGNWKRMRLRRIGPMVAAAAGLVAHTWYLGQRVAVESAAPLSSPHDWYLAAAWTLAAAYLAASIYYPRPLMGMFLLVAVLGLVAASAVADTAPLASFQSPRFWGMTHGVLLMLGTVAVLWGFLSGVMYLVQSHRLKRKLPRDDRFSLPSLEWLERANSESLGAALVFVTLGFVTGVVSRLGQAGGAVPWTDPVVVSLSVMLLWLLAAEAFRVVYPAARRGRKVAYLTVAAFVFLLITLSSFTRRDSLHQGVSEALAPGNFGDAPANVRSRASQSLGRRSNDRLELKSLLAYRPTVEVLVNAASPKSGDFGDILFEDRRRTDRRRRLP